MIAYMSQPKDSFSDSQSIKSNSYYPIIEINVSCKDLAKLDIGIQSDSMCTFFTQQNGIFTEFDHTEIICNNPSPNFVKSFKTYYIFESNQPLRFEIYNCFFNKDHPKANDLIGYFETDVKHIISHLGQSLCFDLKSDKNRGKMGQIILTGKQSKESNAHMEGQIQVSKLKKLKTFAKNNPFFEIIKMVKNGKNELVYRSEVKSKCFSCTFKEFTIPIFSLITNNLDDHITISFFDNKHNKSAKFIGKYEGSVRQFMESKKKKFDLYGENDSKQVGSFMFTKIEFIQIPTIVDYLQNGLQFNMITAIGFTKSSDLLHFTSDTPDQLNQYQQTIQTVGTFLAKFNHSQNYRAFGFGGKIGDGFCSCFPLTFDMNNPEVSGVEGIIDAYRSSIQKVQMWGNTELAPVIKEAAQIASQSFAKSRAYGVLLIMIDGDVDDIDETINAIVEASEKPLSIVIVGVGNCGQDEIPLLDAGESEIESKRDIVKFVPFAKVMSEGGEQALLRETLAEIPRQVHEYCSLNGFAPKLSGGIQLF